MCGCGCGPIVNISVQYKTAIISTWWAGIFWTLLARSSYMTMEPALVPTAIRRLAVQWDTWGAVVIELSVATDCFPQKYIPNPNNLLTDPV